MRHAAGGGPTPRPGDTLGYIATDLESAAVSDFVQVLLARLTAAAPAKTKHNRRKLGVTAAATEPPVVFCLSDADEDDDDRMEEKAAGRPAGELCVADTITQSHLSTPQSNTTVPFLQQKSTSSGKSMIKFALKKVTPCVAKNALEEDVISGASQRKKPRVSVPAVAGVRELFRSQAHVPVVETRPGQAITTLVSEGVPSSSHTGSGNINGNLLPEEDRHSASVAAASAVGGVDDSVPETSLLHYNYGPSVPAEQPAAAPPVVWETTRGQRHYSGENVNPSVPIWMQFPPPCYGPPQTMNFPPTLSANPSSLFQAPLFGVDLPPSIQHNPAPALIQIPLMREDVQPRVSPGRLLSDVSPPDDQLRTAPPSRFSAGCQQESDGDLPFSSGKVPLSVPAHCEPDLRLPPLRPGFSSKHSILTTIPETFPSPSPSRARLPMTLLPRPVAAGGCRTCVLDSVEQLAALEPRPCLSCPLLEVVSAGETGLSLQPGQIQPVAAVIMGVIQQQLERVRVFCGDAPRAQPGCLTLPAADQLETGARHVVCPVQGGVILVTVINSQRETLVVTKGLKLGFGQPVYIRK